MANNRLFVGQIPKEWKDCDLKNLFETYGKVLEANVIIDKYSGFSRGCGFVTYLNESSSQSAQEGLHSRRVLDGMFYPMYVRPSDVDGVSGKKIFAGMIGRYTSKADLDVIFSKFGELEDITVLVTPDGTPKGCAFIKYCHKEDAAKAVAKLHNLFVLPGCFSPIVVRIADTEQEKVMKKFHNALQNITQMIEGSLINDSSDEKKQKVTENNDEVGMELFTKKNQCHRSSTCCLQNPLKDCQQHKNQPSNNYSKLQKNDIIDMVQTFAKNIVARNDFSKDQENVDSFKHRI